MRGYTLWNKSGQIIGSYSKLLSFEDRWHCIQDDVCAEFGCQPDDVTAGEMEERDGRVVEIIYACGEEVALLHRISCVIDFRSWIFPLFLGAALVMLAETIATTAHQLHAEWLVNIIRF